MLKTTNTMIKTLIIILGIDNIITIYEINSILNLSVQNYRANRNNLKNTYVKASLYFQR